MAAVHTYHIGEYIHWSRANGDEGEGYIREIRIYRNADGSADIMYTIVDQDPEIEPVSVNETQVDGLV